MLLLSVHVHLLIILTSCVRMRSCTCASCCVPRVVLCPLSYPLQVTSSVCNPWPTWLCCDTWPCSTKEHCFRCSTWKGICKCRCTHGDRQTQHILHHLLIWTHISKMYLGTRQTPLEHKMQVRYISIWLVHDWNNHLHLAQLANGQDHLYRSKMQQVTAACTKVQTLRELSLVLYILQMFYIISLSILKA